MIGIEDTGWESTATALCARTCASSGLSGFNVALSVGAFIGTGYGIHTV